MQIQITSTGILTEIDGHRCRVWEGITAQGVPCKVMVARIAVDKREDGAAFERELIEMGGPHWEEMVLPLRMIL